MNINNYISKENLHRLGYGTLSLGAGLGAYHYGNDLLPNISLPYNNVITGVSNGTTSIYNGVKDNQLTRAVDKIYDNALAKIQGGRDLNNDGVINLHEKYIYNHGDKHDSGANEFAKKQFIDHSLQEIKKLQNKGNLNAFQEIKNHLINIKNTDINKFNNIIKNNETLKDIIKN